MAFAPKKAQMKPGKTKAAKKKGKKVKGGKGSRNEAKLEGMYAARMYDPKEKKRGISDTEAMLEARVGGGK